MLTRAAKAAASCKEVRWQVMEVRMRDEQACLDGGLGMTSKKVRCLGDDGGVCVGGDEGSYAWAGGGEAVSWFCEK